jgi:hypothetical protein
MVEETRATSAAFDEASEELELLKWGGVSASGSRLLHLGANGVVEKVGQCADGSPASLRIASPSLPALSASTTR